MLAASAVRAGFRCIAIDLFADTDTRSIADCVQLSSFQESLMLPPLSDLCAKFGRLPLVYGSGIDTRPKLLEKIARYVRPLGNSPAVLDRLQAPKKFFAVLDRLQIPYPEVRFSRPCDPRSWLYKIPYTEGGFGVLPAVRYRGGGCGYFQKKIESRPFSVSFIANQREARILGFNTQSTAASDGGFPYRFSGIINRAFLSREQKAVLSRHVDTLVGSLGLTGFHSLDFLIEDSRCLVLEVNPRPCASLMLYDRDFDSGLLNAHIRAVEAFELPEAVGGSRRVRGLEIVYAPRALVLNQALRWPSWVVDRPAPGTRLSAGDALLTVTAAASSRKAVVSLLALRRHAILESLALLG